jgi:hypothetical protein
VPTSPRLLSRTLPAQRAPRLDVARPPRSAASWLGLAWAGAAPLGLAWAGAWLLGASLLGACGDDDRAPPDASLDAGAASDAADDMALRVDGGPPPSGCDRAGDPDAGPPLFGDGGPLDPAAFPRARGPGASRTTFGEEQLFRRCGDMTFGPTDERHHNTGFFLDGYLVRPWAHERGRGGVAVFAMDAPCTPVLIANVLDDRIRETHSTGYSTVGGRHIAVASLGGVQFWDVADVTAPRMVHDMALPDVRYPDAYMRVVMSVAWQAPYLYVGASDNGVFVIDAADVTAPRLVAQVVPEPLFRVGNVHALGNLLVVMGSENTRVALYDISLPDAPRPHPGGGFQVIAGYTSGGRPRLSTNYFGMLGGGYTYHARNGIGSGLAIFDVRDFNAPRFAGAIDAPDSAGGYVFLHEGLAFVGLSSYGMVYDVRDPADIRPVGRFDFPGDLDTITPLGNVAMVSVDDDAEGGVATGIFPWQREPDRRGPRVTWTVPQDGADMQSLLTRVGLTFDEFVAMESVWHGSVQVREVGAAAPLDGWYSGQEGQVNFWPAAPLRPGTTYEIVVPVGGVHDVSGNPITEPFRATFTTARCGT